MKNALVIIVSVFLIVQKSQAQEPALKRDAIKWGLGFGFSEGKDESGLGLLSTVGYQRSYGAKKRWRLNPGVMVSYLIPALHAANRSYGVVGLNMTAHYDLLKYKIFSLVTSGSVFSNYTSGKTRAGRFYTPANSSFSNIYFGGGGSIGFRVDDPAQKRALEIRLINIQAGTNYFEMGYISAGLDFKLSK